MFGTDIANGSADAATDSSSKPRILFADDHVLVREAIGVILSPWFRVKGIEGSSDIREAMEHFHPDVLIIDISLPSVNGLELAQQILGEHPTARIIFLTMHEDHFYVRKAFESERKAMFSRGRLRLSW